MFLVLAATIGVLLARGARERRVALGLALLMAGWGAGLAVINFGQRTDPTAGPYVEMVGAAFMLMAAAGAGLALTRVLPTTPLGRAAVFVVSAFYLGASFVNFVALGPQGYAAVTSNLTAAPDQYIWYAAANRTSFALALACALSLALGSRARAAPLVSVALAIWPATTLGEFSVRFSLTPTGRIYVAAAAITVLVLALAWVRRRPVWAGLVPLAFVDVGLIEAGIAGGQTALVGVVRICAGALLALAILRHDMLGADLGARTTRRSSTAIVALAALFVVAQVAIPFVSGAAGLALGGVVAAGLTVIAPAMQRTMERRDGASMVPPSSEKLDTYRDAIRYALRDGTMTRREEMHLAKLAQQLGIGAADALRVRHEVEDERRP